MENLSYIWFCLPCCWLPRGCNACPQNKRVSGPKSTISVDDRGTWSKTCQYLGFQVCWHLGGSPISKINRSLLVVWTSSILFCPSGSFTGSWIKVLFMVGMTLAFLLSEVWVYFGSIKSHWQTFRNSTTWSYGWCHLPVHVGTRTIAGHRFTRMGLDLGIE